MCAKGKGGLNRQAFVQTKLFARASTCWPKLLRESFLPYYTQGNGNYALVCCPYRPAIYTLPLHVPAPIHVFDRDQP
jgi:hypothetical protein